MDLEAIQKRALAEGLPYQTLISSLLHKQTFIFHSSKGVFRGRPAAIRRSIFTPSGGRLTRITDASADDGRPTHGRHLRSIRPTRQSHIGRNRPETRPTDSCCARGLTFPRKSSRFNHFLNRTSWLLLALEAPFWELTGTILGTVWRQSVQRLITPVCAHALRSACLDESAGRHVGTAPAPHQYDA